eukprot:Nitzschia sp. Nitz4//scaffold200_size39268//25745//29320//NITZ4_007621-RA/size39268-processed-gene-0.18-mRNA-1//-1//CDS//3329541301//4345//frame0
MKGSKKDDSERPKMFWNSRKETKGLQGFGSPQGMELTSSSGQQQEEKLSPPRTVHESLQALADVDSPPAIFAVPTGSDPPTPSISPISGRESPPDMMQQLVGQQCSSPRRDTPGSGRVRPPRQKDKTHAKDAAEAQIDPLGDVTSGPQPSSLFASPAPSSFTAASPMSLLSPSLQPHMFLSPPPSQILKNSQVASRPPRTGQSTGLHGASVDPVQMGTPTSSISGAGSMFGHSTPGTPFTPGTAYMTPDNYDSADDSDTSVKERLTDQVRTLNELLLSTNKQLGKLGYTNSIAESPASNNDNLEQEEQDLEDVRRALQQELMGVDYSFLEATPTESPDRDDDLEDLPPLVPRTKYPDEMIPLSPQMFPSEAENQEFQSEPSLEETQISLDTPAKLSSDHREENVLTFATQEGQQSQQQNNMPATSNVEVMGKNPSNGAIPRPGSVPGVVKDCDTAKQIPSNDGGEVETQLPISYSMESNSIIEESSCKSNSDVSSYGDYSWFSWLPQFCGLFLLLVLVAVGVGFAIDTSTPDREVHTVAPSQTPSLPPSSSPTSYVVALSTVYQIRVSDGQAENITHFEYEADLIQSMDRLCTLVETNLPQATNRAQHDAPTAILPTSIREFRTNECPSPDSRDRCEIVVAEILLEYAQNDWSAFLTTLNLAMATGQLQHFLDIVNPNSPVDILRSDGDYVVLPTRTPTTETTQEPTSRPSPPLLSSIMPTMSTSSRHIETRPPTIPPTMRPTIDQPTTTLLPDPPSLEDNLLEFLVSHSYDGGEALLNSLTPQHEAFTWLAMNNKLSDYSDQRLLQRYALATLYYSTDGDNWFFSDDWLSDEDECDWYSKSARATCSKDGAYVNLELNFNNMNGVLPPELGLLSNSLRRLSLQGGPYRYTGGTIPTELGYLSLLERFFIRNNEYSGTIPTQIGAWSNLKELDVSSNSLTGDVPSVLGLFEKLTSVDLSVNVLQGRIPSEIGNLANCEKLIVEYNILTGPVPTEIGRMTQLHSLRGGSNLLTRLPTEIGGLSPLETLSLYQNDLVGTVPSELSQLMELNDLDLSNNGLTGLLPSQLGLLVDIRDQINLSSNRLSGSLSTELGNLEHLRVLRLESNELTGPIPSEISGLSSLTTIRLDGNAFSGEIPNEVCGTFNETLPAFSSDCMEFDDNCPCCVTCCTGTEESCECRYLGTMLEYLCYQQ